MMRCPVCDGTINPFTDFATFHREILCLYCFRWAMSHFTVTTRIIGLRFGQALTL